MKYSDRAGQSAEGDVVSPGPLYQTVWVSRGDGTYAVVNVGGRGPATEMEYEVPQHIPPVPIEILQLAQEIVDRYREACEIFAPLGATPMHADHDWAVGILARVDQARKSRLPFLHAHGVNSSVGEKKLSELSTVTAEIDGEQVEQTSADYRKYLKALAKQKD